MMSTTECGIKVRVIGLATMETPLYHWFFNVKLFAAPIVTNGSTRLESQGADVVILLSHAGINLM